MPSVWDDRVALLDGGRMIAQGAPREVLTPERLRSVYGVSVVVEQLSQGQIVCAPDYGLSVVSHRPDQMLAKLDPVVSDG